jgi:hypothetical protein
MTVLIFESRRYDLLFLERPFDPCDPVTQLRSALILHAFGSRLHALLQQVNEIPVLAFDKEAHL